MKSRAAFQVALTMIVLGSLALGLAKWRSQSAGPNTESYGHAPAFSLVDSAGRAFDAKDLDGRVWIADFIFTHCAGTCPTMTAQMRKLQDMLPNSIRLVSFSVDPSRDTPDVLNAYAQQFGADPSRWVFLTGERQLLYDVSIKGFKLAVDDSQGTPDEPITHSTRFVLVDKAGEIRGYYGSTESDVLTRLSADAKKLL